MDIEKVRLENGTELDVCDADARQIIGDGQLDESFSATDLTGAANELKTDLGDKVDYHLITASDGYTSNASKTALQTYCNSLDTKVPIIYTLDAGSLGFGFMFKGSSNYALIIYYQYGNGTITKVAMTKYAGTWSDWFAI